MGQSVTQYEQPKPVTSYPTQQTYPQQATHATAYPNPNPERYSLSQGIDPKFSNGRGPTNRTNSRFDIPASGEADHRRNSGHRANSRFDTGSNGNSRQRLVAGHVLTGFTRQPNHPCKDLPKRLLQSRFDQQLKAYFQAVVNNLPKVSDR